MVVTEWIEFPGPAFREMKQAFKEPVLIANSCSCHFGCGILGATKLQHTSVPVILRSRLTEKGSELPVIPRCSLHQWLFAGPIVLLIAGCSTPEASHEPPPVPARGSSVSTGFPLTLQDALPHELRLVRPAVRIISLLPSETECVFAMGAGKQLIADTPFDDYPTEALSLPKVPGLHPSTEQILAFHPDLVLASRLNPPDLVNTLIRLHVPVYVSDIKTVADTIDHIRVLGRLAGQDVGAERVAGQMEATLRTVQVGLQRSGEPVVRSVLIAGYNPTYVASPDSFAGDALRLAGGEDMAPASGNYVQLSTEALIALQPQCVFLSGKPEPHATIRARPGWGRIDAIRSGRVFFMDGSLVERQGPRIVQGVQEMARDLHPRAFAR